MAKQNELFDTVLRGYDKRQVEKHIEELTENYARQQEGMHAKMMVLAERVAQDEVKVENMRRDLAEGLFALHESKQEATELKDSLDEALDRARTAYNASSDLEDRVESGATLRSELDRNLKNAMEKVALYERTITRLEKQLQEGSGWSHVSQDADIAKVQEQSAQRARTISELENSLQESITLRTELDRNLKFAMEKAAISERAVSRLEKELEELKQAQSQPVQSVDMSEGDPEVIQKTKETRERMLNKARQLREEMLEEANVEADKILSDARSRRDEMMAQIQKESAELKRVKDELADGNESPQVSSGL